MSLRHCHPILAENKYVHTIGGARGVWECILQHFKDYKIDLNAKTLPNAKMAKIYEKLLKKETNEPHTACAKLPHRNWANVCRNIWKNKTLTNKEK
jgi:hypothetical protein